MPTDHDHPLDPTRVAAARARLIDAEEAGRLAGLLGLLADPTRARILYAPLRDHCLRALVDLSRTVEDTATEPTADTEELL